MSLRRIDDPTARIRFGESIRIEIAARLNGLSPGDVLVEMLISHQHNHRGDHASFKLEFQGLQGEEHIFALDMKPELCGKLTYQVRVYPQHDLLTHPHETGLMTWL